MTLTTAGKDWLAINAGVNNCFSPTEVSFVDADGVPFTAGTKDVVIVFIGAHMVGKNDAIIIANTSYNGFKAINGNNDLVYPDATLVYNSDGHVGATLPLYCAPPAQVISVTLTVDTNDCVAPCTVGGTVSWTNNGGSPGTLDPAILINTIPTSLGTAVTIGIGETRSYTFSLPDLTAGTYTVQASPNTGTAPQTIIVRTPAHIISTDLTVSTNLCTEPCNVTGSVSWTNDGGTAGTLDPVILINTAPYSLGTAETINPGQTITHGFSLPPDLMTGTYDVCASPGTHCQTVVVRTPANVISATLTVDINDCVELCTVGGTVSWTNNGGTASPPTNLGITVNGTPTTLATEVTINPGATTSVYTFSLPDLTAGTYTVQASPNTGTAPQIITVRTPANVISATLTVDTTDCVAPCTVGGTVSWTNNGGTASAPTDLSITVNGTPTLIASAIIIGPGGTTSVYTFSIPDLTAGTYTVQASPNAGTAPQTITVRTPANVISTALTVSTNLCTEPCNVTGSVSWTNDGGTAGTFDPAILTNTTPVSLGPTETIDPGQTITHGFSLPPDLMAGTYEICASPGTHCQTVVVTTPANVISATLTVDTTDCVAPCIVGGTVSWTNNGGTASAPTDLSITVNGTPTLIASAIIIGPGETTSVYTFSLPDLTAGTYTVQASPNAGTAPQTITVRTPANVISATLTVDTNDCVELCTVNGNVSWTNNGGSPGTLDPAILVNTIPTSLGTAVTIGIGETLSYTFSLPDLAAGTYTVQASPNAGTAPQTITVQRIRAHFTSTPSGATVYVDDIVQPETTPTTVIGLTAGTHTYRMTHPDCNGNEITGNFTIAIGDLKEIYETFETSVHITSTPSSARIWIDGVDKGVNTPSTIVVTPGHRTYKLTKPGYTDFIGEFDITECQRLTIPASITKVQEAGMGIIAVGLLFGMLLMGKKKEKEKEKLTYY